MSCGRRDRAYYKLNDIFNEEVFGDGQSRQGGFADEMCQRLWKPLLRCVTAD